MNIRTLVLGESHTGKTSFIRRKATRYVPTIGVDYSVYTFNDINLRVWDTAGHERFKQVVQNFYADNMLIIFVYRDKESFSKMCRGLMTHVFTTSRFCPDKLVALGP